MDDQIPIFQPNCLLKVNLEMNKPAAIDQVVTLLLQGKLVTPFMPVSLFCPQIVILQTDVHLNYSHLPLICLHISTIYLQYSYVHERSFQRL